MHILIVGAGIAGFSAAIALRRAGHEVHLYERSSFNNELGAAIHMPPNASRGLLAWGLDPIRARFVTCKKTRIARAATLETLFEKDGLYAESKFGAPWWMCHRVDLHDELKRLATQIEGEGKPAVVHLKCMVTEYDTGAGSIKLSDGTIHRGDLIIAADGLHSGAVETILGAPNPAVQTTHYNFAYRFLIPTTEITSDVVTRRFIEEDDGLLKVLIMDGKRLVSYACRNSEVYNFVAIFQNDETISREDWQTSVDKSVLLERYSDFHPTVLAVLRKATEIKQWPLLFRAPIPTWHKEKLVLIGDAAHPMLPHMAQGGAQAIEDAVALGIVLSGSGGNEDLEEKLQLFEKIRKNRASVMQIFSNAGQDEPEKIREDASKLIPADSVPKSPEEFTHYNMGYDVVRDSKDHMQFRYPEWTLSENFFGKEPGSGVYPAAVEAVKAIG